MTLNGKFFFIVKYFKYNLENVVPKEKHKAQAFNDYFHSRACASLTIDKIHELEETKKKYT